MLDNLKNAVVFESIKNENILLFINNSLIYINDYYKELLKNKLVNYIEVNDADSKKICIIETIYYKCFEYNFEEFLDEFILSLDDAEIQKLYNFNDDIIYYDETKLPKKYYTFIYANMQKYFDSFNKKQVAEIEKRIQANNNIILNAEYQEGFYYIQIDCESIKDLL